MILDAIFYQLYRFYSWLPDWTPHETTIWSVGMSWGVLAIFPLNWLWIVLFSGGVWSVSYLVAAALGVTASFLYYGRNRRWLKIVRREPLIGNSKKWSIALTIIYMAIVAGVFVFGGVVGIHLKDYIESRISFEEMIEQLNH